MSRVGRKPIPVPAKTTVKIEKNNVITVNGPKGTLTQQLNPDMTIEQEDGHVVVNRPTDLRHHKAQHGLTRALLSNMITGVSNGFSQRMEIHGVGYRAEKRGETLVLQLGKSHPVEFAPPNKTMGFEVDKDGRGFVISGIDKCEVGELAAVIRKSRPPEPYQGKGIRYAGEFVKLKAGKSGKK